jgi:hypothetical protein
MLRAGQVVHKSGIKVEEEVGENLAGLDLFSAGRRADQFPQAGVEGSKPDHSKLRRRG